LHTHDTIPRYHSEGGEAHEEKAQRLRGFADKIKTGEELDDRELIVLRSILTYARL
jgi:hypothetical protein